MDLTVVHGLAGKRLRQTVMKNEGVCSLILYNLWIVLKLLINNMGVLFLSFFSITCSYTMLCVLKAFDAGL